MWPLIEMWVGGLRAVPRAEVSICLGGIDQRVARQDESGRSRCIGNWSITPAALVAVLEKAEQTPSK
jgi:hypothetical protein